MLVSVQVNKEKRMILNKEAYDAITYLEITPESGYSRYSNQSHVKGRVTQIWMFLTTTGNVSTTGVVKVATISPIPKAQIPITGVIADSSWIPKGEIFGYIDTSGNVWICVSANPTTAARYLIIQSVSVVAY